MLTDPKKFNPVCPPDLLLDSELPVLNVQHPLRQKQAVATDSISEVDQLKARLAETEAELERIRQAVVESGNGHLLSPS